MENFIGPLDPSESAFDRFENMDRLIAEADAWLDRHAQRMMDDFLDGAEAHLTGEEVPQSFDYMLDEFGCIDDMAVFAARGNMVGGMVVA